MVGPADNAFNRERAAVKAHAAATSGELLFSGAKEKHKTSEWLTLATDLWRRLSI